jgi:F-type H+-transporting ATPase subunit b
MPLWLYNFALLSTDERNRMLGIDQQTLIQMGLLFFNLALIVIILTYLLYKPVKKVLKDRTEHISRQLTQAADDKETAKNLRLQYEAKIKDIDKECNAILENARKQAHENAHRIISEARDEVDTLKKRAQLDIEREQARAKEELKSHIIELSTLMSSKFISRAMNEQESDRLFDEAVEQIASTGGVA